MVDLMNTVLSRRSTRLLETLMGLGTLAAGLVFLRIVHAPTAPYGDPGYIGSAAFFPGLMALLVAALGVVLMLMAWRPQPPTPIKTGRTSRALSAYVLMVVVAIGLPWLGIWLTSMLAVPLLALLFGERRWYILLILAIVPPVLVIHLFEGVMGIYFPRGGWL
ncbi:tripartite tricarboxylate transporter TctB family protein [Halomonas sp. 5021]|uniref:tripartite tricarboxylate transporter TctB family protein n=1 Tax=unclassified Halomonas TaxID=2609666 RepID=UPI000A280D2D|nr:MULTISPECIES: tripartite tricarboxylate transporter TctB family protein [unclassified Halomonas]QPL47310.1 tripartite tricarboxylate transporter TctB family protein [Halomonas sp. A40-4]